MEFFGIQMAFLSVVGLSLSAICIDVWMASAERQGDLSAYELASFNNPDQEDVPRAQTFNHFTLSDHGDVYVGAVNWLYRLNSRLEQIQNASTCDDSMPYNGMPCRRTNNYNKILVVDTTRPNSLITCGGAYDGRCYLRQLLDISVVVRESIPHVAGFEGVSTVGLITNGREQPMLYIAVTYSDESSVDQSFFQPITRRNLDPLKDNYLGAVMLTDTIFFSTESTGTKTFVIRYSFAFDYDGFTYFVASQKLDINSGSFVSKINRVCQTSTSVFDAYTEITIQCSGSDGTVYSLVQAAHLGPAGPDLAASLGLQPDQEVLYAVFAKNQSTPGASDVPVPTDHSALCVYKMTDILAGFKEAVRGCIQNGAAYSVGYLAGSFCSTFSLIQPDNYLCHPVADGMTHLYKYAKGITPLSSTALLELPDYLTSSIITNVEFNHTVAFIGTSCGNLLKVHIESNTTARLYERVPLDTSPVLTDIKINDTTREMHVLTEQKLIKMRVENCSQYTTCEACIGTDAGNDGDPYCGWCTLERKCSRYSDCLLPDVSTRWLAYNAAQCINITNVAPYDSLPISLTEQQINLSLQQLPDLTTDQNYECYFGSYQSPATKTGGMLTCTSPPNDGIPAIQQGDDAVGVDLSVYSTETVVRFIDTSFHFYNCSVHTSCVFCVGSRWACDWCVFENKCTHESSDCTKDNEIIITGQNGPGSCPQLQAQSGEVLLPNGIHRSITVSTENLPNATQISSYGCSLDVEGLPQTVMAQRNGTDITCDQNAFKYLANNEPELEVRLTVSWTDTTGTAHILDDIHGFNATLYKCEVQKPDCSRCVTARPELGCLWCGAMPSLSGVCKLNETCIENFVTLFNGMNCPDPVLSEVFPLTGPIEGNTILAVMGTDIGRRFADVVAVMVGNQPCPLDGLSSDYLIGASVSCRTRPEREGNESVNLTITGADGTLQHSSGTVNFNYTNPRITLFEPRLGPEAGGTAVSVNGTDLNTGRNIEAFIGENPCIISSDPTEGALACTTSAGQAGMASNLRVSFDGANRTSDEKFSYTENPVITGVQPLKSIYSGGRTLNVNGQYLDTCQNRQIYVGDSSLTYKEVCTGDSPTEMQCKSPNITSLRMMMESNENLTFGFIMDGVSQLLTWSEDNEIELEYFEDPVYVPFENEEMEKDGSTLTIMGERLDSAITAQEIQVRIGNGFCEVNLVSDTTLQCTLPEDEPAAGDFRDEDKERDLPVVWVIHSNLEFRIGYIRYPLPSVVPIVVPSVSGAILVCILFVVFCFVAQVYGAKREARLIVQDMRALEKDLADEVRQAFAELQTDLTDLTSDLEGIGMPFVSHREYATNMLFIGQEIIPDTEDEEYPNEQVERAMCKFSQLLSNKNFLLLLIQTLDAESNSKLSIREKQSIASLLTVVMVLENKLVYMTDIMITLMTQLIENAADSNRTRQLFCRTESILEKLLSNWVALCLYDQLKNHTAHPLFVLYRAIKYRSESGPIDVVSGRSRFSLNYEKLLQEDVEFNSLTLVVLIDEEGEVIKEVKVLDVDTVSQVKEKILDALHLNKPYSNRPSANQVSLEWRHGRSGKLVLTDTDMRPLTDKWRRINMLKDFHVPDNGLVTLVEKQDVPNATLSGTILRVQGRTSYVNVVFDDEKIKRRMSAKRRYTLAEVEMQEGIRDWHLTQEEEWPTDEEGGRLRKQGGCISLDVVTFRNKINRRRIREISFPRLLSTKGIIQEYVDNMFKAILSAETAPRAIKYLFDFFDNQAYRHELSEKDSDLVHIWKSNILPLRFWANAIKHPDYIFDIRPSRSVEASLDVIAQLFHDAHDTKSQKLGRETSINKLLYGRERTKYHDDIVSFYEEVQQLPPVPTQELNKELYKACENFTGLFSKLSTLDQLWKLVRRFKQKLLDAIEDNERCKEENLDGLLEEIENILSEEPDTGEAAV
ncbi:plexin-B-like isoform X2 [Acanthaster planci]|uniref:Plexin-B-like isoform X2 n=1 Tax=Acanthaster planci TaxID=133434 RepID=A0A8B7ZIC4_ACAPL|nr:plexin-B-like isoform X2 [Acanthaster planci]